MTVSSKKKQKNLYIYTAAALVIASLAIVYFLGKKSSEAKIESEKKEQEQEMKVNPSGIDPNKNVSEVKDVEEVVAKWIEQNPRAIIASVENMQKKAMEERINNAKKNIPAKKAELFENKDSSEHAPQGYDVSIVEFYDYNCGYCKKAQATVEALIKQDPKIRVIFKEFPILGEASVEVSRVSIAVNLTSPSSFLKFHDALMKSNERNKAGALKIAKSVGLDVKKIEIALSSQKDKIEQIIQSNIALGSAIGISGTPGFVVGDELIPGAMDIETFKEKIKAIRASK